MAELDISSLVLPGSPFPIQNLPYGIFRKSDLSDSPRPGVAIGNYVLDLKKVADDMYFDGPELSDSDCFQKTTLNEFISLGRPAWKEARKVIQRLLADNDPSLRDSGFNRKEFLIDVDQVEMLLPVDIEDFTAFYASLMHHGNSVKDKLGPGFKVNPNWLSQPLAHLQHSSSVVVSETEILRPREQGSPDSSSEPSPYLGTSFLELGAIMDRENKRGKPIDFSKVKDHIFGVVLLNDWTDRKIKKRKMKSDLEKKFSEIISPWIVTIDALEKMAHRPPKQNHPPSQSKDKPPHKPHPSTSTSKGKRPQNPRPSPSTSKDKSPQNHDISLEGNGYCVLFGICNGETLPSSN